MKTGIVVITWSDGKTSTTTAAVMAKYSALYGPMQAKIEEVEKTDNRICWESIPELAREVSQ